MLLLIIDIDVCICIRATLQTRIGRKNNAVSTRKFVITVNYNYVTACSLAQRSISLSTGGDDHRKVENMLASARGTTQMQSVTRKIELREVSTRPFRSARGTESFILQAEYRMIQRRIYVLP